MSDDDRRYDQLRRRLADEGGATAPPDLADQVMRRVRAEPRRRDRRFLRPALTLVAAAALAAAGLVGLAHIDTGSSSSGSSAGAAASGGGASSVAGSPEKQAGGLPRDGLTVRHVPNAVFEPLFGVRAPACPGGNRIAVSVPPQRYGAVVRDVRGAAATAATQHTFDVELHRAPNGQARIRVTCP
jgi:hypothetical protein